MFVENLYERRLYSILDCTRKSKRSYDREHLHLQYFFFSFKTGNEISSKTGQKTRKSVDPKSSRHTRGVNVRSYPFEVVHSQLSSWLQVEQSRRTMEQLFCRKQEDPNVRECNKQPSTWINNPGLMEPSPFSLQSHRLTLLEQP